MTVLVETDFLVALTKESDWLKEQVEAVLENHDIVTSPFSYLELLIIFDRDDYDYVGLVSNLLELVPVGTEAEYQIVLKAVNYYEDGMTPFDSFHAATAETHRLALLSSDKAYENVDAKRIPLEPRDDSQ